VSKDFWLCHATREYKCKETGRTKGGEPTPAKLLWSKHLFTLEDGHLNHGTGQPRAGETQRNPLYNVTVKLLKTAANGRNSKTARGKDVQGKRKITTLLSGIGRPGIMRQSNAMNVPSGISTARRNIQQNASESSVKTLLNQEKHCERQEVFSLFCLFVCLFVS
jgi:hypothetical protein